MCSCASTKPGKTVALPRSITRAPTGILTCACGPTSVMRSPDRTIVCLISNWPVLLSNRRPARIAITPAGGGHCRMPPSGPTHGIGPAPRQREGCTCAQTAPSMIAVNMAKIVLRRIIGNPRDSTVCPQCIVSDFLIDAGQCGSGSPVPLLPLGYADAWRRGWTRHGENDRAAGSRHDDGDGLRIDPDVALHRQVLPGVFHALPVVLVLALYLLLRAEPGNPRQRLFRTILAHQCEDFGQIAARQRTVAIVER